MERKSDGVMDLVKVMARVMAISCCNGVDCPQRTVADEVRLEVEKCLSVLRACGGERLTATRELFSTSCCRFFSIVDHLRPPLIGRT